MTDTFVNEKVPIRGWLVLIGIAVWIMGIIGIFSLIVTVVAIFVPNHLTVSPVERVVDFIVAVVSMVIMVLFVKRKTAFVRWSVVFLTFQFVYGIYFATRAHPKLSTYANFVYLPLYVISAIYLIRSSRVKNTFNR